MSSDRSYTIPLIVLFSDGYFTDNFNDGLKLIKDNIWFRQSYKIALGIQDYSAFLPLIRFTGCAECVWKIKNSDEFNKTIQDMLLNFFVGHGQDVVAEYQYWDCYPFRNNNIEDEELDDEDW